MKERKYIGSTKVAGVSPTKKCEKKLDDLQTIGLKMNYEQVREMIELLEDALKHSANWNYVNVTGYREPNNYVTVTYWPK